ncbi:hypothetical protein ACFYNW_38095 [Streptomyces virginiae]|uniref:hypothetical protein n=1 Tax=Streptomyces virginiae TaxID=1961 RepID=UPI0036EC0A67
MDAGAVAAALEDARLDARQASRYEDLAADLRGPAELAEWERIAALLAAAGPGAVYDPDVDDVVQAELAADAAIAGAQEAELREAVRIAARATSRCCGTSVPWTRPSRLRTTKPYATSSPAARAGTSRPTSMPGSPTPWPRTAGTTAARPPARPPPALTPPVLAHAALLGELRRLVPSAGADQLEFAARLAATEPEAVGALAAFLTRCPPTSKLDQLPSKTDCLHPALYLLRALVTRNAAPAMTIKTMAMIQKGGEPCPAPLAKSCMCNISPPIRGSCL